MDVSGFVAGGKHKRKRLQKEKVDVSKAPKGNAQGGGNKQGGQGARAARTVPDRAGKTVPAPRTSPNRAKAVATKTKVRPHPSRSYAPK